MTKQIVNKYRHFKSVPSKNVVVVLEVVAACFCLLSFKFCAHYVVVLSSIIYVHELRIRKDCTSFTSILDCEKNALDL